jgi:[NiFe] hydrogenase diaphorase moiety large subunit
MSERETEREGGKSGPFVSGALADTSSEIEMVTDVVVALGSDRTRLMDMVLRVQDRFGYVGPEACGTIAAALGIHSVEVADMVSFYAFLDRYPRGQNRIRLSKGPISFMKGAEAVALAFERELGIAMGETTQDRAFTVEWTSDIGMADQEPAALVNGVVLTHLVPADVPVIVATLRGREDGPKPITPTEPAASLRKALVRDSLVLAGPLLTGQLGTANGLQAALAMPPETVVAQIGEAKLRGRGGPAFRPA